MKRYQYLLVKWVHDEFMILKVSDSILTVEEAMHTDSRKTGAALTDYDIYKNIHSN